jgi:hypothetical protein
VSEKLGGGCSPAKLVSDGRFPANKENNRVFEEFWSFRRPGLRRKPCATAAFRSIPYERYQGISAAETGINFAISGIFGINA